MRPAIVCSSLLFLAGCSSPRGLARLQGMWLVDVDSTMREHHMTDKQVLPWDEDVTRDNLSRIRYEFRADTLVAFVCYQAEVDPGQSNRVSVYEEDDTSVTILLHPDNNGYTSDHPPLAELIKRGPIFSEVHGIYGLKEFEFTKADEAKLFHVTLDMQQNRSRAFSGIHLVRTDGPVPERKRQLPRNISLENPDHQLAVKFTVPATDETWDVTFVTIDESSGGGSGQHNSVRKVYTSRSSEGVKVTAKYRWDSGRCEASFIVPYGEDAEGHLNGVTYRATWQSKDEANIGRRNQVRAQQMRQFLRIDPVVLVLAAMDGLQIQRMSQHERNSSIGTGIGKPGPVEGAFADHGQLLPIRLGPLEEVAEVVAFDVGVDQLMALLVHHAHVHLP